MTKEQFLLVKSIFFLSERDIQRKLDFGDIVAEMTASWQFWKVVRVVAFSYLVLRSINMYEIQSMRYCITDEMRHVIKKIINILKIKI